MLNPYFIIVVRHLIYFVKKVVTAPVIGSIFQVCQISLRSACLFLIRLPTFCHVLLRERYPDPDVSPPVPSTPPDENLSAIGFLGDYSFITIACLFLLSAAKVYSCFCRKNAEKDLNQTETDPSRKVPPQGTELGEIRTVLQSLQRQLWILQKKTSAASAPGAGDWSHQLALQRRTERGSLGKLGNGWPTPADGGKFDHGTDSRLLELKSDLQYVLSQLEKVESEDRAPNLRTESAQKASDPSHQGFSRRRSGPLTSCAECSGSVIAHSKLLESESSFRRVMSRLEERRAGRRGRLEDSEDDAESVVPVMEARSPAKRTLSIEIMFDRSVRLGTDRS